jgi:serine/threonine protein kinase
MGKSTFREYSPGVALRNGKKVYVVEGRIAHGKFGYAFACRDERDRSRILQIVWPFSRSYENVRERWAQQATELRQVEHPGLVSLLDAFEHEGCFHLVQERCDHRLDLSITAPDWDGSRALLEVARPVLHALAHVHGHGYTHRNLHPRNVLCAVSGRDLKLGDLAVDVLLGNVDVLNAKISRWLVPPEYLNPSECGPMDHRVDIYQAALLLLCVLRGRVTQYSFEEISLGAPAKDAGKLASPAGPVLARALQPQVADRFGTALELWDALRN